MASPAVDLNALRQLSVAERRQLVEDLWDSIAQDAPDEALPMTPELAAELDRRIAEDEREEVHEVVVVAVVHGRRHPRVWHSRVSDREDG